MNLIRVDSTMVAETCNKLKEGLKQNLSFSHFLSTSENGIKVHD